MEPSSTHPATEPTGATSPASRFFKDPSPFICWDCEVLESRLELMEGFITPVEQFFVRNNGTSIAVDPETWRLVVEGDAVPRPLSLSYQEIRNLPSRSLFSYLECAGNQRSMFTLVNGQPTEGTPWMTGGVGNGEWTGVPMREVLQLAGIRDNAVEVLCIGLDLDAPEQGFRRALPVAKAMHPDTLLAYALNGEPLPKDHGFPLRVVAPGWAASSSIKWLGRLVVSANRFWTRNNTTAYVMIGDAYTPEGEAHGKVITTQNIKSALALPWPAKLPAGKQRIAGFAHSPAGTITQVEWSSDRGATWQPADLVSPQIQYSWVRFEFWWEATPGDHTLMTRATDIQGNTQPDRVPFNKEGYLFNQPIPHPVTVV